MNSLEEIDAETTDKFWHLYVNWCDQHNVNPKVDQFLTWYQEQYS